MILRKFFFLYILIALTSCQSGTDGERKDATFVWSNPDGAGRASYVMFRQSFDLGENPGGTIHLFVDSRYHLLVNGVFINFGPARFYPEKPEYDTYDLEPYLREGENVIAVKALSNGMNTFQMPLSKAGFIAWGKAVDGDGNQVSLATPGEWKFREMEGYNRQAPKMSFATGPVEIYDARKDPRDWDKPGFDDTTWEPPVPVNHQDHWGELAPRSIPHLTSNELEAQRLMGAYSLKEDEEIISFRVKSADRTREEFGQNKWVFAYTYIYSPRKQSVPVGLWWGEHWLNGEGPLPGEGIREGRPLRSDVVLDLDKGWNFFFIKYGIVWGSWEFYMALPGHAGLAVSPVKDPASEHVFMTAGPFTSEEEELVRALDLPFDSPTDLPELSAGWVGQDRSQSADNPAINVAWSYFRNPVPVRPGKEIILEPDPPKALVYDMGGKTLGRFFVEFEASEGTEIDLAFAEDMTGNRPWILKRAGIYTGIHYKSTEGHNRMESFKPYGARFLQLNVTGAESPVTIKRVGMVSHIYPFRKLGSFSCSDTMLNAIWELGWRTLRVCSEDSYTDTPFRERGLYAGDALPEYAITLAASGDSRLMQRSIKLFSSMYSDLMVPGEERAHASVNHMADYPLLTLVSYAWTYNRTRDREFAETYYEGYKNMLNLLASSRMDNGLLDHGRAFIEWTQIDKHATLTTIQSLAAYCFESMAYMAGELGYPEDREWFLEEEGKTLDAMHRLCWDEDHGAFRDGYKEGVPIDHYYPISSIWPSLFGQTTPQQEEKLAPFYARSLADIGSRDRHRLTTPYGGFYVLGGLYRHGYTSTAEKFMKKYWSPMILKHNDTAWENFGDGSDGNSQGTLSHAWSGGPTYHMSAHVLGADFGFPELSSPDTVIFKPQASGIEWARGSVPHPLGVIHIDWELEGDTLFYNCEVPEGLEWKVEPRGAFEDKVVIVNP